MKKLISIMLCVLLLLPTIGVHAETTEGPAILSPVADAIIPYDPTDNTPDVLTLSARIPGQNVKFFVNGKQLQGVSAEGDIYSVSYPIEGNGTNKLEVIYDGAGGKDVLTCSFKTVSTIKYNYYGYAMAGKDTPATIGNNSNIVTNAYGGSYNANNLAYKGRVCLEATVTLSSATAHYWLGVGTNLSGWGSTVTGWNSLIGSGLRDLSYNPVTSTGSIFAAGKIGNAGTDGNGSLIYDGNVTYEANVPFVAKIVFDLTTNTLELYKDGVLAYKSTFTAPGGSDPSTIFSKLKMYSSNASGATMTLENTKLYNEATIPEITEVVGATNVGGSYIIPENTSSISVTFDKAFTTLTSGDVKITKADGSDVRFTGFEYNAGTKTAIFTGITGIKSGDILNISVLSTANISDLYGSYTNTPADAITDGARTVYPIKDTTATVPTGTAINTTVYVGDTNKLFVQQLDDFNGSKVALRYINGGEADASKVVFTKIADSKLAGIDIQDFDFNVGSGIVEKTTDIGATVAMIWNENYIPVISEIVTQ